jgi:hemerythrin
LIEYAKYHFATEEHLMLLHEYHGLKKHLEEHEIFNNRVKEIQIKFHNEKINLFPEVLQFIQNWFSHHILKTDAEYGRFAKELTQLHEYNCKDEGM